MRRVAFIACASALSCVTPSAAHAQAQAGPFDNCDGAPRVVATGERYNNREKDEGKLTGSVEIECGNLQLFADEVSWDAKTLRGHGKLLFVDRSQGLTVYAERMEMDRATRFGTFFNAQGFARLGDAQGAPTPFGSQELDIQFKGEKFARIGPDKYRLTHGQFSTCDQPTPRWHLTGSEGTVVLDKRVILKNAVLRVKDVPLLYLPFMYYPINKEGRSTGFLMPSYSTSSLLGSGFSNAFFWAMKRYMDATFYHTYSSKAGNTFGTDYRYVASPGSEGNMLFKVIGTRATMGDDGVTVLRAATRSYDVQGGVSQGLPRGFRLIGNANYFTSIEDQQKYEQNLFDLSQRSRSFSVNLSGTIARWYRLSVVAYQRDYFSTNPNGTTTAIRQGRAPQVDVSFTDRPIGRSRIYAGGNAQLSHLIQQPDINADVDQNLLRFDAAPRVRVPLSSLPFLSATASASLRVTHWRESIDLVQDAQVAVPMTRSLFDFRTDVLGPVLARIWTPTTSGYAERFKHLIEPRVSFQWLSPFAHDGRIVQIDSGIDNLPSGTMTIDYSLTNRLLARRKRPSGPGVVTDIMSVTISQSRYSEISAGLVDSNYPTATNGRYSPLRITARVSPTETLTSTFQTYIDPTYRKPQQFSASASITRPTTRISANWSKTQFIQGADNHYGNPASAAHALGGSVTLRPGDGRFSGTYFANFDVKNRDFVQQRIVASYNAQCCGITMDYQTVSVGRFGSTVYPANRSFGISFSLAGIGSFTNPFGSFGDNTGRR